MKTMQFYIGDEPNDAECDVETFMAVRTMLESVDDVTQMHNMLLDSGADASVFPVSNSELGSPCNNVHTVLRDAQGQTIPLHGYRDVELHFIERQDHTTDPMLWSLAGEWMECKRHGTNADTWLWDFNSN